MPHNEFIARLRGVAVLMVVLMHYAFSYPISCASVWFVGNGHFGVGMFFTISGFLITTSLLWKYGYVASVGLRNLYVTRAAGMLPCLALTDVVRRHADIVAARLDVAVAGQAADWSPL